mmetsp:Transcript_16981/g.25556  ORF Transcript_16981/g.25556 Transcript_16981/m.25556 type:complete len:242 (+) Transcript_16981:1831-2556(+)
MAASILTLSKDSSPRGRGFPIILHSRRANFMNPSTLTARRQMYRMSGPDVVLREYLPTSMSKARASILVIQLVNTSGLFAISLYMFPNGVANKLCNFSGSITGISLTISVKSADLHLPGSNNAASTINCNALDLSADNRPGSPLAKKSKINGMRMYGAVRKLRKRSLSAGLRTWPNVGSSELDKWRMSSSDLISIGFDFFCRNFSPHELTILVGSAADNFRLSSFPRLKKFMKLLNPEALL